MSDTDVDTTPDFTDDTPGGVDPAAEQAIVAPSEGGAFADDDGEVGSTGGDRGPAAALLVREGDIAADYLERLLDIVDYDGDIDLDVENDRAAVAIVGGNLRALVGGRGETLDALQELTRLAVQQQTGVRSRLMLDIGGFRSARRDELVALANDTAQRVASSGEPVRLSPMNPFERKVVHDAVSVIDGVSSESEGEEPHRRVVIVAGR